MHEELIPTPWTSRDFVSPALEESASLSDYALGLHGREVDAVRRDQADPVSYRRNCHCLVPTHPSRSAGDGLGVRVQSASEYWSVASIFWRQPDEVNRERDHQGHLSYCLGAVVGRWDLRYALGTAASMLWRILSYPRPPDPVGLWLIKGLQTRIDSDEGYPLRIDRDGILVDDPDHSDDIVRRVRDVLEVIWKDRADAIEKEACEILGVKELRDYFRKPGKGASGTITFPATPRAAARPRSTGCSSPRRRTTPCGCTTTDSTKTCSSRRW